MKEHDLCWCKSGKEYIDCHKSFDEKLEEKKQQGYLVPPKSMIKNEKQIEGIRQASLVNNGLLDIIEKNIHIGMSTEDIDVLVTKYLKENKASSADYHYMGYPKHVCTSVNDVVCHGVPSEKVILKDGDIINVDATTEFNGYYGDASRMFLMGEVSESAKRLVRVTKECLDRAVEAIVPWETTLNDLGLLIEKHAHRYGYSVVEEFCGHGVGLSMHENPYVLHYGIKEKTYLIVPGMTFTIEPMINEGKKFIHADLIDGWTIRTNDHKLSAQWEYTLVVTEKGVEILSK